MSVRMFKPATLAYAYSLTRLQEAILEAMKKKNKPPGSFTITRFGNGGNYGNTSQLFSLVLVPDEEDCFEDYLEEDNIEVSQEMPLISLHAMNRVQNYKTLRVKGTVGKHTIHILVDCGSTYNFVDVVLAKKLGCHIRSICPLVYHYRDGYEVAKNSECKQFKWQLQGVNFCFDVMLLPLVGCEMILGIQWLSTFGDIKCNFKELRMEFVYKSKKIAKFSLMRIEGILEDLQPEFQGVVEEFDDIFAVTKELPPSRPCDYRIPLLEGTNPINIRPYRQSHSPFVSPIVMVKKKDNTWRMCVDYIQLNNNTIKDKFLIPIIEELIDKLHGSKIFSKLDLRSGYHQIRMHEEDVAKTAFKTHQGHYKFLVMPFGLTNAPSTFHALMNEVFKPFLRKFTVVFFDNILIYSKSLQDHVQHLRQVEYLGHVIYDMGVSTDPSKIKAMENWHVPTNVKQLRGFLGLTG
ncbi:glycoside hydrolase, catalytic domain-containing protein, partial [Tanacetum coccineum]